MESGVKLEDQTRGKDDLMDYVTLGHTGLEVSRICLGCMSYGVPERGPTLNLAF